MAIKTAASGETKISVGGDTVVTTPTGGTSTTSVGTGQGTWSSWLVAMRAQLVASRGLGPASSSGSAPSPLMSASDGVTLLSLVAPGVVRSIGIASGVGGCVQNQFVGVDGSIVNPAGAAAAAGGAILGAPDAQTQSQISTITNAAYVAGIGLSGSEWLRAATQAEIDSAILQQATGALYTFPRATVLAGINDTTPLWHAARQIMPAWQAICTATAAALQAGSGPIQQPSLDAFWGALTRLCSTLDTVDQNPPPSDASVLIGAFNAATAATSTAVKELAAAGGKALGDAANVAGAAIGQGAAGFFKSAGLPVLLVAGIAVYIAIH